jgi:hypothetical protein
MYGACAGAVAVGVSVAYLHPSVEVALIIAIAVACTAPIVVRLALGRFDIFEPLVVINLALLVMYVGRPAGMLWQGQTFFFKTYNITARFGEAVAVALLGVVAVQVGYALPNAARLATRLPSLGRSFNSKATVRLALALAATAFILYGAFLTRAGGLPVFQDLLSGRFVYQDAYYRDSSAYLYSAPLLLWPASLLLVAVGLSEKRPGYVWLAILLLAPLALLAGGQGSRIVLLPLLAAPAIYFYLSRGRRPGPIALILVTYLVFTVGIGYFRDVRAPSAYGVNRSAELKQSVTNPSREFNALILQGRDNDMFESFALELEAVPERLKISPLEFAVRTAAKPIPSVLWHSKPVAREEQLTTALFPEERVRASSSAGVLGSFYLAGGLPGVALGMMALGLAFRLPWEYAKRYAHSTYAQLLLTASLMFIPILLRGSLSDTLARALFMLVPLFVAFRLGATRQAPEAESVRSPVGGAG